MNMKKIDHETTDKEFNQSILLIDIKIYHETLEINDQYNKVENMIKEIQVNGHVAEHVDDDVDDNPSKSTRKLWTTQMILARKEYARDINVEQMRMAILVHEDEKRRRDLLQPDYDDNDGDCCPLCLEEFRLDWTTEDNFGKWKYYTCCGKRACSKCAIKTQKNLDKAVDAFKKYTNCTEKRAVARKDFEIANRCPCCFTSHPSQELRPIFLNKQVEEGKAWALHMKGRALVTNDMGYKRKRRAGFKLLLKAAEKGNMFAQVDVGTEYYNGQGTELDQSKAVYWWRQGSEQGHGLAQLYLSRLYSEGTGVEKDENESMRLISLAAAQGVTQAMQYLGMTYYSKILDETNGTYLPAPTHLAIYWSAKAAKQGSACGIAQLAGSLLVASHVWHGRRQFSVHRSLAMEDLTPGHATLPTVMRLVRKVKTFRDKTANKIVETMMNKQYLKTLKKYCAVCKNSVHDRKDVELKACSTCKVYYYCGKKCQTRHWKLGHKIDCQKHWCQSLFSPELLN
mmetsp:Transcript_38348/g.44689  ORF Transcript_38348/g.44689 Transcript_38348/m.44689 type:complete len:511 (+) Transcript_38348:111-1643(+)